MPLLPRSELSGAVRASAAAADGVDPAGRALAICGWNWLTPPNWLPS
jgi:hypothetical protein